jgi:hypothetical protein
MRRDGDGRTSRGATLILGALSGACAAAPQEKPPAEPQATGPQPPPKTTRRGPSAIGWSEPSRPFAFESPTIDVQWIPAFWITPDVESDAAPGVDADLEAGTGGAARIGMGTREQDIGLLYTTTWHDERASDTRARTHALYVDFVYRTFVPDSGNAIGVAVAAGLGGARLDFDDNAFESSVEGAAQIRGEAEFHVADPLVVSAGLGLFLWGHPGDTVAYGSWLTVGIKVIF